MKKQIQQEKAILFLLRNLHHQEMYYADINDKLLEFPDFESWLEEHKILKEKQQ